MNSAEVWKEGDEAQGLGLRFKKGECAGTNWYNTEATRGVYCDRVRLLPNISLGELMLIRYAKSGNAAVLTRMCGCALLYFIRKAEVNC